MNRVTQKQKDAFYKYLKRSAHRERFDSLPPRIRSAIVWLHANSKPGESGRAAAQAFEAAARDSVPILDRVAVIKDMVKRFGSTPGQEDPFWLSKTIAIKRFGSAVVKVAPFFEVDNPHYKSSPPMKLYPVVLLDKYSKT